MTIGAARGARGTVTAAAVIALLATACSTGGEVTGGQAADAPPTPTGTATAAATAPAAAPTATPTAPTPTATSAPADPSPTSTPLVAGPEGLGAVRFGQPAARAIAAMRARFGPADADSGWQPAAGYFGVCPGAATDGRVRGLRWGRIWIFLSDADTDFGSGGTPHVFSYHITSVEGSGPAPDTAAGIGLGSTVRELRSVYGSRVTLREADEINPPRFILSFEGGGEVTGQLTGTRPDATVTFLRGGQPCGE